MSTETRDNKIAIDAKNGLKENVRYHVRKGQFVEDSVVEEAVK